MPAAKALKKAGLSLTGILPKEPLAMVNGTSTMTGIAALVVERAWRILSAAVYATALSVHALKGNAQHYHPVIAQAKPFPGQAFVAAQIFLLLQTKIAARQLEDDALETLQDPYSLRCAPQVVGVLYDGLSWIKKWWRLKPIVPTIIQFSIPRQAKFLWAVIFTAGMSLFAMDGLKAALASVADMCDRQIMLLVNPNLSRGLPGDLVRTSDKKMACIMVLKPCRFPLPL